MADLLYKTSLSCFESRKARMTMTYGWEYELVTLV